MYHSTYYYSLLTMYNLGIVNTAHDLNSELDPEGKPHGHMYAHMYHQGIAKKSGNKMQHHSLTCPIFGRDGILQESLLRISCCWSHKNTADALFNVLKKVYQKSNVGTMEKLFKILNTSPKVIVHKTEESHFYYYDKFLSLFYRDIAG